MCVRSALHDLRARGVCSRGPIQHEAKPSAVSGLETTPRVRVNHVMHELTHIINPRRACAARVTVLGLCVCVSVTQHLTFHVIIRATNDTNLLSGG